MAKLHDKGTNFVDMERYPFVKLSKDLDRDTHKRPMERGWETKRYTLDDAMRWVDGGHGVGLNVAGTQSLGVIDIDEASATADAVAQWFGEGGALVCATPSGGWHIFLSRHSFPFSDGRYRVETPVGSVKAEWYRGDAARQLVLPVAKTPRAGLGGRVAWSSGKKRYDDSVSLPTLVEMLEEAAKATVVGARLEFLTGSDEGRIKSVFGKSIKELTQGDILARLRSAERGERHNTLLTAAIAYRMRGWSFDTLRSAGYEMFAGERTAQKEVEGVLSWADKLNIAPISEVAEANVKRRTAGFADLVEAAFGGELEWYAEGDEIYILTKDGYALRGADGLAAYLAAKDIPIATERAKRLLLYIQHYFAQTTHALILRSYPVQSQHGVVLGVRVGERVLALVAGNGEFGLRDPVRLNAYVEWGAQYRTLRQEDVDNAKALSEGLLKMLGGFFVKEQHAAAHVALLLAATVLSKTVTFVVGESGSGKTTLSQLLQYVINGRPATLSTDDKRDFIAVLGANRLVGFEEVDSLPNAFWNDIKIFTTVGELSQRSLYTNKGITLIKGQNTFIFSTTDVKGIPGDVLRRSVLFSPSIYRRPLPEDQFAAALAREAPRYVVGLMYMLKDWRPLATYSLEDMLTGKVDYQLPDWLLQANKSDLTTAYYYMYKTLGVSEEAAKEVWEKARAGAAQKALGAFGELIERAERDESFAEKLEKGMSAAQIAEELGRSVRGFSRHLASLLLKVAPMLAELGWSVSVREEWSSHRNKTKVYSLKRLNKSQNDSKDDDEEAIPF